MARSITKLKHKKINRNIRNFGGNNDEPQSVSDLFFAKPSNEPQTIREALSKIGNKDDSDNPFSWDEVDKIVNDKAGAWIDSKLDKVFSPFIKKFKQDKPKSAIENIEDASTRIQKNLLSEFKPVVAKQEQSLKSAIDRIKELHKQGKITEAELDKRYLQIQKHHEAQKETLENKFQIELQYRQGAISKSQYEEQLEELKQEKEQERLKQQKLKERKLREQQKSSSIKLDSYDTEIQRIREPKQQVKQQQIQQEKEQEQEYQEAIKDERTIKHYEDSKQYFDQSLKEYKTTNEHLTTLYEGLRDGDYFISIRNLDQLPKSDSSSITDNLLEFINPKNKLSKLKSVGKGAFNLARRFGPIAMALGATVDAGISAFDTESIAEQQGKSEDEVTLLDRLSNAGAGAVEGATFGLVNKESLLGLGDRIQNFVTGNGFVTNDQRVRLMEAEADRKQAETDQWLEQYTAQLQTARQMQTVQPEQKQTQLTGVRAELAKQMGVQEYQDQQPKQEYATQKLQPIEQLQPQQQIQVSQPQIINNNSTTVVPEQPRFRLTDTSTYSLSYIGNQ